MTAVALAAALMGFGQAGWSVDSSQSLTWAGAKSLPVGVRIAGEPAAIQQAAAAGIKWAAVELPASGEGWKEAIQALEAGGMQYVISLSSPAPSLTAWIVEPDGYRRAPVVETTDFSLPLPGVAETLAVSVARRDGVARWHQRVPAQDGLVKFSVDPKGVDQAVLLYPRTSRTGVPDFWEKWDAHRDGLLRTLKAAGPSPGLRGILDPAGRVDGFAGTTKGLVPDSALFRLELQQLLAARYRTVTEALKQWALRANDITSFTRMARLIPLWFENRGAGGLYDPVLDRVFLADPVRSRAWSDIHEVMEEAMHRRYNRLVGAMQGLAPVPVLQSFRGWAGPYSRSATALAGIGAPGSGATMEQAIRAAAEPAGMASGWIRPPLAWMTDLEVGPEQSSVWSLVAQTAGLGMRGWFFRAPASLYGEIAAAAGRVSELDSLAARGPILIPYPVEAEGLASPRRLTASAWWVPSPGEGARLYLGSKLEGYRLDWGRQRFVALWTKGERERFRFRAQNPRAVTFESYGEGADAAFRGKNLIEATIDRTPMLLRDLEELPAPIEAFEESASWMRTLFGTFEERVEGDGGPQSDFADAVRVFDEQPGASLIQLGDLLMRSGIRTSTTVWVEGEAILNHTFAGPMILRGGSRGQGLGLVHRLPGTKGTASFRISPRRAARHEVWVAGRLPIEGKLTATMGAQTLELTEPPAQVYGDGLVWRKLGEVELPLGETSVQLQMTVPLGEEGAIDMMVFSPDSFRPDGTFPDLSWIGRLPKPAGAPGRGLGGPP